MTIAIQHHQAGQLQAAEQIYRQILQVDPNQPDALHLLGVVAFAVGKVDVAVELMTRALQLNPNHADAYSNLGVALAKQGNLDQAAECYRRALALKPDYAEAHNNLGNVLSDQGNLDEAVSCYQRALALRPDYTDALNNLGNALKDQGSLQEAVGCFQRALTLKPDYAEASNNLGIVLSEQGDLDQAVACYRQALALNPGYAEAHSNLGNVLKDQGKLDEAVAAHQRALELNPHNAESHSNLGIALKVQGKLEEAAACYGRTLALKPDHADARWNQSLLTLLSGALERGWPDYEWRWKIKQQRVQPRNFVQPLWDGQPLAGRTILLHAEQGLGDTIQFIRYAPLVKERGGRVVVECQPPLLSIFAEAPGIDQLIGQGEPLPPFDVQTPLLSLPGILGTTLKSIPDRIPYLKADSERTESWRKKLERLDGFKVGIVWQGNPDVKGDRQRSIALHHFEALAHVDGVRLLSLQKGSAANQLRAASFPVLDLGEQLETFGDTAAVLTSLDLMISSCTSVPHLAGALGVPVWLALPFVPDWRWFLEREDSPWYPHHRLFRQTRPGAWSEVFERIAVALAAVKKGARRQESGDRRGESHFS